MDNTDLIEIVLKYKKHKKVLASLIVEYLWKNLKNDRKQLNISNELNFQDK